MNLIKTIDEIDDDSIKPTGITTNGSSRIYLTDQSSHSVIMTDIEFNKIKSYGSFGEDDTQFNRPFGVFHARNNVFVCDTDNKRLQILTADLDFIKSIKVEYHPWKIRIADKIACVSDGDETGCYFYELDEFNNFTLKHNYQHGYSQISFINPYFIEVSCKRMLYFYNLDGTLLREFSLSQLSEYICSSGWDGCMLVRNNYLVITSDSSWKLIRLPMKNLLV